MLNPICGQWLGARATRKKTPVSDTSFSITAFKNLITPFRKSKMCRMISVNYSKSAELQTLHKANASLRSGRHIICGNKNQHLMVISYSPFNHELEMNEDTHINDLFKSIFFYRSHHCFWLIWLYFLEFHWLQYYWKDPCRRLHLDGHLLEWYPASFGDAEAIRMTKLP